MEALERAVSGWEREEKRVLEGNSRKGETGMKGNKRNEKQVVGNREGETEQEYMESKGRTWEGRADCKTGSTFRQGRGSWAMAAPASESARRGSPRTGCPAPGARLLRRASPRLHAALSFWGVINSGSPAAGGWGRTRGLDFSL